MAAPSYEFLTDTIGLAKVYWVRGSESPGARPHEVMNPPVIGWGHVLLKDGDKQCTLFCPFTFQTYRVSHRSAEYASLVVPQQSQSATKVADHLLKVWSDWTKLGSRKDFGMAAEILRELGYEPPALADFQVEVDDFGDPIAPPENRKGKVMEEELKKPVKRNSKRGKLLSWFLKDAGGPKSIHACMAEFAISRSNALSYLFMLQKDHGIGYQLGNNTATVFVPGRVDPFID